jgi:hypothetical protein
MQGTILQVLVLVTHGNLFLSGQPPADFFPQHNAFKFTEVVKFVDLSRDGNTWKENLFAATPNDWLSKLQRRRCTGLKVDRISTDREDISDRMSVAFIGGGGRWIIEAVCPDGSDYWEAKWEIGNQQHPDRKIWRVTYGRIAHSQKSSITSAPPIDHLSDELSHTLQNAITFSKKHKLNDWFTQSFEAGYSALQSGSEPALNGVALKGQLPLAASRLIAASQAAWVFGGMGSWNDLGFDGDEQVKYTTISDDLFRIINSSLVATTNLSYPKTEKIWWQFWK